MHDPFSIDFLYMHAMNNIPENGRKQPVDKLIYIIDDEENIREILEYNLTKNGYGVKSFQDGSSFLDSFNRLRPDLVILDLMLPDMDGFDICRKIKEKTAVPVIILSAKGEELDRVLGLELGADDYMVKPFSVRELLARVKNIFRRVIDDMHKKPGCPLKEEFIFKEIKLIIDEERHEIFLDSRRVYLNPKEFQVVLVLLKKLNNLVPRMELIKAVWGDNYYGDTRTLDVHIRRIRKKMAYRDFGSKFIKTIHGYGYRITDSI